MAARRSGGVGDAQLLFHLEIPFPSQREAVIALQSLSPDPEPRRGGVTKSLSATDNMLCVKWTAEEARILRVSVGSFLDHLALVMETMDEFGQTLSQGAE